MTIARREIEYTTRRTKTSVNHNAFACVTHGAWHSQKTINRILWRWQDHSSLRLVVARRNLALGIIGCNYFAPTAVTLLIKYKACACNGTTESAFRSISKQRERPFLRNFMWVAYQLELARSTSSNIRQSRLLCASSTTSTQRCHASHENVTSLLQTY